MKMIVDHSSQEERAHHTPRATWRSPSVSQEAEGMRGKVWAGAFNCGFHGKEWVRQGKQA